MNNNNQFAHSSKESNIENFYKIMSGEKKIITKKLNMNFRQVIFAMCFLLLKDSFLKMIDIFWGE